MTLLLPLLPFLAPLLLFLLGFAVYCVHSAIVGPTRTPRLDKLATTVLMPRICVEYAYLLYRGPTWLCLRLGVSPDMLTYASLLLTMAGAVLVARGDFALGGWTLLAGYTCDALDGVVARASGTASDRGDYLDSVVDVYSDLVTYLGFAYYYRNDLVPLMLVAGAMVGSALVTFARAKGAALGVDVAIGLMRRFERTVWIGGGTVLSPVVAALVEPDQLHPRHHLMIGVMAILLVLTHVTVIWRVRRVFAGLRERASAAVVAAGDSLEGSSHAG